MRSLAASPVVMQRSPTDLTEFAEHLLINSGAGDLTDQNKKVCFQRRGSIWDVRVQGKFGGSFASQCTPLEVQNVKRVCRV